MRSIQVLAALNNVQDAFVLESALPSAVEAPLSPPAKRRREGKDGSLGRVFSGGWAVAAVCTLVAAGTLTGLIYLGQNPPPLPPVHSDVLTQPETTDTVPDTEGVVTESLIYVSHGDGTCSVKASSGFGEKQEDVHLVIPEVSPQGDTVTAVAEYGFIWKTGIQTVILPGSVERIGQWAFAGCSALESVTLPTGLAGIETAAFLECTALTEIILPEGLTTLGDSVFSTCTALQRVSLPGTLAVIPKWAFYNCAALKELTFSEGNQEVGYSAFCGCTALSTLDLPASLLTIGSGGFAGCTALLAVTVPEGLTVLENLAFDGCTRLATVTLPQSLERMGSTAFRECSSLRTVVYTGTREAWRALGETKAFPAGSSIHCADGVLKQ